MRNLANVSVRPSSDLGEACRLADLPVGTRASAQAVHFTHSIARSSGLPVLGVLLRFDRPVRTMQGTEASAVWLNVNWRSPDATGITAARMAALGATSGDFDLFPVDEKTTTLKPEHHEAIVAWAERFRGNRVSLTVRPGAQGRDPFAFLNRLAGAPVAPAAVAAAAPASAPAAGFSDDDVPF